MKRIGLGLFLLAAALFPLTQTGAQADGIVISMDGEVLPGDPITEAGLPIEGYDCTDIYWLDGEPQYQNRVAIMPFTVNTTSIYRFFVSNGIRTPLPEPDHILTPEELIALENAFPRPYVMLYRGIYDINHPTAYCLWAARDERTPYLPVMLEADMPYFLAVSYEGNEPEWSFRFHVTVEQLLLARYHICYAETDPACVIPALND